MNGSSSRGNVKVTRLGADLLSEHCWAVRLYVERPGTGMDNALREALWDFGQFPTLQTLWASTQPRSAVDLAQARLTTTR